MTMVLVAKSKRECLGYDPIFKVLSAGPAAIQPAPSSANSASSVSAPTGLPTDYASAVAGRGGYAPALLTGASSPGSSVEPYDYSAAIDPALEAAGAAGPALTAAAAHLPQLPAATYVVGPASAPASFRTVDLKAPILHPTSTAAAADAASPTSYDSAPAMAHTTAYHGGHRDINVEKHGALPSVIKAESAPPAGSLPADDEEDEEEDGGA
ncbi:MAG: hypothetical protein M1826_001216 [Phylliscum demangeonii]|nr:MAG: hypothetical protein M1826_001216 [Phylliscum demangeonii]